MRGPVRRTEPRDRARRAAKWVAITDDDCVPAPDWLVEQCWNSCREADPGVGRRFRRPRSCGTRTRPHRALRGLDRCPCLPYPSATTEAGAVPRDGQCRVPQRPAGPALGRLRRNVPVARRRGSRPIVPGHSSWRNAFGVPSRGPWSGTCTGKLCEAPTGCSGTTVLGLGTLLAQHGQANGAFDRRRVMDNTNANWPGRGCSKAFQGTSRFSEAVGLQPFWNVRQARSPVT
jgi:hypothetical protein